ncbi:TetR/AcrR family transcriptional regulator [Qaidamihabitans albus]|uniref:TetR/AcrR family transcriptional regulator n=1 Tax=Qaidamihabitans albus TaxID=2795733 RepID=UPI0018F263B6|nr:TetR/AcrR family transcriptional regulator [Qaidamihabitans albus]
MTNLVDRASSRRGRHTREQLVDAGIALLGEGGWSAITTRAVAERSGVNAGLIHYHFGGLPRLRVEIARRAVDLVIGPVVELLVGAPDERAALAAVRDALPVTADERSALPLVVELLAGALRDPELGADLREQTRLARDRIADRLAELHPDWTRGRCAGTATMAMSALDGLALHLMLDPEAPAAEALDAAHDMIAALVDCS